MIFFRKRKLLEERLVDAAERLDEVDDYRRELIRQTPHRSGPTRISTEAVTKRLWEILWGSP